jgi:cytoplasmic iron level regulating protein YaaA (DUF328/UPF0246 family)
VRLKAGEWLENPESLKAFDVEGYGFNPSMSDESTWVFTRKQ